MTEKFCVCVCAAGIVLLTVLVCTDILKPRCKGCCKCKKEEQHENQN